MKAHREEVLDQYPGAGSVLGHGDFDDGRRRMVKKEFVDPSSEGLHWVNVMLGNDGYVVSYVSTTGKAAEL